MTYLINDFTGLIIGLFVVYVTVVFANRWTQSPHNEDVILGDFVGFPLHYGFSAAFVVVPVLVWYVYQFFLNLGPKGTSKAIKI